MGFAAGFGQGFSTSFNQQRQRSHERETDEFRYRMETLIKKKDKYDEYKREDAQLANKAKEYVQMTGQPPEAVGEVYRMLRDKMPEEYIIKKLESGKFSVSDKTDDQMQASGIAEPQAPQDTTQAAPAPEGLDGGGFLSRIFPGMKKFNPGSSGVDDRVAKTTGMTPEEIAQIDQGYSPPEMNTGSVRYQPGAPEASTITEAKVQLDDAEFALKANPSDPELQQAADAARRQYQSIVQGKTVEGKVSDVGQASGSLGTVEVTATGPDGKRKVVLANSTIDGYTDQQGNPLPDARPRTAEEVKMAADIQEKLGEPAQKYNDKAANLAQAYTAFGTAQKIIEGNPEVLQERTAGLTQYFVDLGKDVVAGMKLVDEALANPESADPGQLQKVEKSLEAAMADPSIGPLQKLAAAKGLLNVQYAIAAYHVAASKGQENRGLSETERKMFQDLPNQATSPEQWNQLIGSLLVPEKQALDKQAEMLPKSDPRYDFFLNTYGYSPVGDLNPMEQYLQGTAGADLDRTLPQSGFGTVTTPDEAAPPAPDGAPPEASGQPVQISTPEEYAKLPKGTQYKDPNGVTRTKG